MELQTTLLIKQYGFCCHTSINGDKTSNFSSFLCPTLARLLSSFSLYCLEYCIGDGIGINDWCIIRLLQQTPSKKHLCIVTAVFLKNENTLLPMPDPGNYIYVLTERTRQRSILTVHQALPPRATIKFQQISLLSMP